MKVLGPQNEEEVLHFERVLLNNSPGDEIEKEMASWKARWRKESLEHYLKLGWSFGIWDSDGKLEAYLLGQPLIFFQSYTQTLWVEHISVKNQESLGTLVEVAYRWARDKHFQRVLFSSSFLDEKTVKEKNLNMYEEGIFELKSSKYI